MSDDDIEIDSTLAYESKAPLSIHGKGQTVKTKVDTRVPERLFRDPPFLRPKHGRCVD